MSDHDYEKTGGPMKTVETKNTTDITFIPDDFIYSLMLKLSNSFTNVSSSKLEEVRVLLNKKVQEFEAKLGSRKSINDAGLVLLEICALMRYEPFKSFAIQLRESTYFPLNGVARLALRKKLNMHYSDYKKSTVTLAHFFIERSMKSEKNGEIALANVLSDKQFQKITKYWEATKR